MNKVLQWKKIKLWQQTNKVACKRKQKRGCGKTTCLICSIAILDILAICNTKRNK